MWVGTSYMMADQWFDGLCTTQNVDNVGGLIGILSMFLIFWKYILASPYGARNPRAHMFQSSFLASYVSAPRLFTSDCYMFVLKCAK